MRVGLSIVLQVLLIVQVEVPDTLQLMKRKSKIAPWVVILFRFLKELASNTLNIRREI